MADPNEAAETTIDPNTTTIQPGAESHDGDRINDEFEDVDAALTDPGDELEEIEFAGKKHKIPKDLKDGFLMREDYTRKTTEVAEDRKSIAAERAQVAEERRAIMAEVEAHGNLVATRNYVKALKDEVNSAMQRGDVEGATKLQWQLGQFQDQERTLSEDLNKKHEARGKSEQEAERIALDKFREALPTAVPNWSPELGEKITKWATAEGGYSRDELSGIRDPRLVKTLNLARIGAEHLAAEKAAKRVKTQETVQPVPEVGTRTNVRKSEEDMTTAEWMKHRSAKVQKREAAH